MSVIDTSSSALYFMAANSAANSMASKEVNKEKTKKVSKSFSSHIKDIEEKRSLVSQGLPVEIAGMSIDDSIDFLKDELDVAADDLGINATPKAFDRYKKAVGQFVKFLEKNNFEIGTTLKSPKKRKASKYPAYVQVRAINEELDKLAYDIWYNHLDNLKLLEKIHHINGLVIDLLAT